MPLTLKLFGGLAQIPQVADPVPHLERHPWKFLDADSRASRKITDMLIVLLNLLFLGKFL